MAIKFIGNGKENVLKGTIHFENPTGSQQDYTLCGITLDGDTETAGGYVNTNQKVNCEHCIRIVEYCKKIKL